MPTLTITDFKALLSTAEIITDISIDDIEWTDEASPDVVHGFIWNTLAAEGLKVSYQEAIEYPKDKPSLCVTTADIPETWNIDLQIFVVIDDDGDSMDDEEIWDIINDNTDIVTFDFSVLGVDSINTLPGTVVGDTTIVESFNHINIAFTGGIIAQASTSPNSSHPDYSGNVGMWEEYTVYKTTQGAIVLARLDGTQWDTGESKHYAMVVDHDSVGEEYDFSVLAFFGQSALARELYDQLGLNNH